MVSAEETAGLGIAQGRVKAKEAFPNRCGQLGTEEMWRGVASAGRRLGWGFLRGSPSWPLVQESWGR